MAGIGDTIRNAVLDMVPGDAARKVSKALSGANSSLPSMNDHADAMHPVPQRPNATRTRKDGSLILMGDKDY